MAARVMASPASSRARMKRERERDREGGGRSVVGGGGECAIIRKSASLALAGFLTD